MAHRFPTQLASNSDAPQQQAPGERYRITLVRGDERWNFRWDPGSEATLISTVAELARNPNVPFDWFDAAVVCRHIAQPFATQDRAADDNSAAEM